MIYRFNIFICCLYPKEALRLNVVYVKNIRDINKFGISQLGPYIRITWGAFKNPYAHVASSQSKSICSCCSQPIKSEPLGLGLKH